MPRRRAPPIAAGAFMVLAALAVAPQARAEVPIPGPPDRWVTDRAAFLSTEVAAQLDARLGSVDRTSGHQILVYIDRTTGGVPIEDWAVKAFERWKVGRKGMDDGAVLFLFTDDHKVRIEVGYGLEARVTDARASRIINEGILPRMRAGDHDGAVRAGVDALLKAVDGPVQSVVPQQPRLSMWQLVLGAIVIVFLLGFAITHPGLAWLMLMSIGSGRGGSRDGWGGGGGFSGGGGRSGGGGASGSW